MSLPRRDIRARITLVPTEEGGRKTAAFSGYRPQFYYNNRDWDAPSEFIGVEVVEPGQTFETYLTFASPHCHAGRVVPGMPFEWREGDRVVGHGIVLEILDLETAAAQVVKDDSDASLDCWEP